MILLSVEKVLDKGLFFLYLFVFEMEAFIIITRSRFSESQNFNFHPNVQGRELLI